MEIHETIEAANNAAQVTGTEHHWHSKPAWMTAVVLVFHFLSAFSVNDVLTGISLIVAIACGVMTAIINLPKFIDTIKNLKKK